jgi:hypothetical protein
MLYIWGGWEVLCHEAFQVLIKSIDMNTNDIWKLNS